MQFSHLHCHSQFSLLDGASSIKGMIAKAKADGMPAVALTDHGNMFGAFHFVAEAEKQGVKPIVGCEFYVVEDRFKKSFTKGDKDIRYHQLLLAKNQEGYENLSKLCSLGFIDGLYGKYPRVDKELIKQYSKGLIATTCCIGAIVPQTIIKKGEAEARKVFEEWMNIFGKENYFIELQRHNLKNLDGSGMSQEDVNQVLIKFSGEFGIPVIATNDAHYIDIEDYNAHDILLCVNTGEKQSTPGFDDFVNDDAISKDRRFKFPNDQFFFKTTAEMEKVFADIPFALDNTNMIVDAISPPKLTRDILLPNFTLPEGFTNQGDYLTFLTYEGAKKKYGVITAEVEERINFELKTIIDSGYPGYFLIVQDFTTAARLMDVWVGPGRGSAAGSVVAYALGITNVDPIKYDLLFERFLNPERVSMPDIDIDFDDVGREKVIKYVIDKYSKERVAQIITYGSMAAKSSIKDVGRVLNIPLADVTKVTKAFPNHLGATLNKILKAEGIEDKLKGELNAEQLIAAKDFRKLAENNDEIGNMIQIAKKLEGSVRNTGIHACGVIITPDDITKFVPVTTAKDSDLLVTQFDNSVVEKSGLLKMDFLGLKTLTIIKDAIRLVKRGHDIDIIADDIPLDDPKTFELFQKGETVGIFQYESPGMQKYLRDLQPDIFEDLIAMNALYRPGPIKYIPNFVNRKHGREKINYDLPEMEDNLKSTYGITVYQEQVMLLSQKLANFTKGDADTIRKAMGKKQKDVLDKMKEKFLTGAKANGHDEKILEKIWTDWEAFASYAFNKSHSTCYAYLAFHTAYLKAHFPAEFMASVLTHNMGNIDSVKFFLQECKRMKIDVLGPDVNESADTFVVNKNGAIRFAMTALKGMGQLAVEEIIRERETNGIYKSIFDMARRLNLRTVNKRAFEGLAFGGGFDCFENTHRAQYFSESNGESFLEKVVKFGNQAQQSANSMQNSLFGGGADAVITEPAIPKCEPWHLIEKLNKEKEVTGIYISGHPLDDYQRDISSYSNCSISEIEIKKNRSLKIAGIVTSSTSKFDKTGAPYGRFVIEDFSGSREIMLFKKKYIEFKNYIDTPGNLLFITCSYATSRWKEGEFELEITQIELLSEIRNKLTKEVFITAVVDHLQSTTVQEVVQVIKKYPGEKFIKVNLLDKMERMLVSTNCRGAKVNISNEFISELELIPGLSVSFLKNDVNALIDDKLEEILAGTIQEDEVDVEVSFEGMEEDSE
ncbi:MAG: DNA polymerase III subunit alpha [Bacteroidota bacterium]